MLRLSVADNQIKCRQDESLQNRLPRSGGRVDQPSQELKRALLRKR